MFIKYVAINHNSNFYTENFGELNNILLRIYTTVYIRHDDIE